jgi:sec-independent protein translocase protein TatA
MFVQLAMLSEWHLILLLIIVFLLFGGKKLPELARGVGEAMKEFKKASREAEDIGRGGGSASSTVSSTPQQSSTNPKNN